MTYNEVLYAGILLIFGGGLLIITSAFLASRKVKHQPVTGNNNIKHVQDNIRYEKKIYTGADIHADESDFYYKSSLIEISNDRYPEYSYEYREAGHSNEFEYRKIKSPRLRVINNFEN